ncbi:unnamed protein product [Brugia timori]|uniref:Ovule protein n=1 Tax=Brugia timori TaxID=42155 RepID=A0A0R3QZ94_9BILA|nr:unnamed protein product [Brugia timori]
MQKSIISDTNNPEYFPYRTLSIKLSIARASAAKRRIPSAKRSVAILSSFISYRNIGSASVNFCISNDLAARVCSFFSNILHLYQ